MECTHLPRLWPSDLSVAIRTRLPASLFTVITASHHPERSSFMFPGETVSSLPSVLFGWGSYEYDQPKQADCETNLLGFSEKGKDLPW